MGYTAVDFFMTESRRPVRDGMKPTAASPWSIPLKEIFGSAVGGDGFSPLQESMFTDDRENRGRGRVID